MGNYWQTLAAGLVISIFLGLLLWNAPPLDDYPSECLLWQSGETSNIKNVGRQFEEAQPLTQDQARQLNQNRHQYSAVKHQSWRDYDWHIDYEFWLKNPCLYTYWSVRDRGESLLFVRFPDSPPPHRHLDKPEFWIASGLVLDSASKEIIGLTIWDLFSESHKTIWAR